MADGLTYGIAFPFRDSPKGDYLLLTEYDRDEVRSDLIHLILTRKGSRYYLPLFGTRIYEFIFEPLDNITFGAIEADLRDAISTYMPGLIVNNISIEPATIEDENPMGKGSIPADTDVSRVYRLPGKGTSDYTAKIRIDYLVSNAAFAQSDFVIINI